MVSSESQPSSGRNRRRHPRHKCEIDAILDCGGGPLRGTVVNISRRGACFRPSELPQESVLVLPRPTGTLTMIGRYHDNAQPIRVVASTPGHLHLHFPMAMEVPAMCRLVHGGEPAAQPARSEAIL